MSVAEDQDFQVILLQEDTDQVAVSRAGQLVDSFYTTIEFRITANFETATAPGGHNRKNTVPASWLGEEMKLPTDFISNIPAGSREFSANQAGLRWVFLCQWLLIVNIPIIQVQ